jgi:hypothetical protein
MGSNGAGPDELEVVLPELPKGRPAPDVEEYVGEARLAVERLMKQGLKDALYEGTDRTERAEEYARWRHEGYVNGEVASL